MYAYAEVWVDAGRVLDDVIELIGDLAAGSVPLEIVTEVVDAVRVFHFNIPVKGSEKSMDLFADCIVVCKYASCGSTDGRVGDLCFSSTQGMRSGLVLFTV